jgi:hypothetical protein
MRNWLLAGTFTFLLMGLSVNVSAGEHTVCTPVTMTAKEQNKEIMLAGPEGAAEPAQIYLFKNIGSRGIWIDHPVERPSASAGWSSYLRAGNSSALLVNRKTFAINCAVIKPGKVEYLDCGKVVTVCLSKAVITKNRKGTYWLVEDKSWEDVVRELAKRAPIHDR